MTAILIERSFGDDETLDRNRWLVDDDADHYSIRKYRYRRDRRWRSLKICRESHEYLNTTYKKVGILLGLGPECACTGIGCACTGIECARTGAECARTGSGFCMAKSNSGRR